MLDANQKLFEIASKVFQKASSDPTFRALALSDGTAAVEQVIGSPLPDGVKIRFVENDGATLTLGLPPSQTLDELSDRELEAVAGGASSSTDPWSTAEFNNKMEAVMASLIGQVGRAPVKSGQVGSGG